MFPEPLVEPSDLAKLTPDGAVQRLGYVGKAITMMRHLLNGKVPLIGFTGAPVSVPHPAFANSYLINISFSVDPHGLYD